MANDSLTMQVNKEIEELNAELKRLDDEEVRLLIAQARVDQEIDRLVRRQNRPNVEDNQSDRRFITSFDIKNQNLIADWDDPADLPPTRSTYDIHQESLMVPYRDPVLLPKKRTTFDAAVEALTQEYKLP